MNGLIHGTAMFCKRNASTILTCLGGAGVIVTSITVAKATPKALKLLEEAKIEKQDELTIGEKIKIAGPKYIPSILLGAGTIACIFGANVLNKRSQAALMSAYTLLDTSFKEYKNKVLELYGEDGEKEIRSEIAKDHYKDTEISVSDDKQLFYDEFSQRYFEATLEDVLRAEYTLNRMISVEYGVFLNDFYDLLGIDPVDYGDYLGWIDCELVETTWYSWLDFIHTKVVMDDGLECTIITFSSEPTFDFENY